MLLGDWGVRPQVLGIPLSQRRSWGYLTEGVGLQSGLFLLEMAGATKRACRGAEPLCVSFLPPRVGDQGG